MNAVTATATTLGGNTMADTLMSAMEGHSGNAVRYKRDGSWVDIPYSELRATAREIARGLMALGVGQGDRVAILSNTRAEWTYADVGALCAGAVVAPVYQTNSPSECQYVLEHSGSKVVFCEDRDQLAKIEEIRSSLPALEHVVAFEDASGDVLSLDALRSRASEVDEGALDERVGSIGPDELLTIVYTSGTTGPPKGCMLTHGNFRADIEMTLERIDISGDDTFYVFLPLAHVLTRMVQMLALCRGSTLAYWQGDPKKILDEVKDVQPTILPSVPRIFEKIHQLASAGAHEAGGAKAKLFDWAVGVGRRVHETEYQGKTVSPVLKAQHALADKLVLHRIRDLFGGQLRLALTGAAPIDPEILEFFGGAGVFLREGYGMTETSAVATLNALDDFKPGTVGKPLDGCECKIA